MAQVAGRTNYDWDWHYRWNACIRLLRDLASEWAMGKEIPVESALAVIVRTLSMPLFFSKIPPPRSLRLQLPGIGTLDGELATLDPSAARELLLRVSTQLTDAMQQVRKDWTAVTLQPDEQTVLRTLVGHLFDSGLSRRPPLKETW